MTTRTEQIPLNEIEALKKADLTGLGYLAQAQTIFLNQPVIYPVAVTQLNALIAALPAGAEKTALEDYMTANVALGLPAQILAILANLSTVGKKSHNPALT